MSLMSEFRQFAVKGNAIDLAVGVVIGVAFGAIVNSLVKDIIMPPIGYVSGGLDFSNLFLTLSQGEFPSLAAATQAGAATINYGVFINTLINFLIVAWALFFVLRAITRVRVKFETQEQAAAAAPPPAPPRSEMLLAEIRDLLKARSG
jgi:large conductance mechanosensitive channel